MSGPMKPGKTPAVVTSAHFAHIKAVDVVPALLSELQKAEQIILAMLNAMTSAQKSKVHARLDAAGVSGEGMTRHHERRAAIAAADAALPEVTPLDTCSPDHLTPDELSLLRDFRGLNDESRGTMARIFQKLAKNTITRQVPRTQLRLVVGGAS